MLQELTVPFIVFANIHSPPFTSKQSRRFPRFIRDTDKVAQTSNGTLMFSVTLPAPSSDRTVGLANSA